MRHQTDREKFLIDEINSLESVIESYEVDSAELINRSKIMESAISNIVKVVFDAEKGLLENWFDKIHDAAIGCSESLKGNDNE